MRFQGRSILFWMYCRKAAERMPLPRRSGNEMAHGNDANLDADYGPAAVWLEEIHIPHMDSCGNHQPRASSSDRIRDRRDSDCWDRRRGILVDFWKGPLVELRISLSEENFRELVAGEIVDISAFSDLTIKLALQDIGFKVMLRAVYDAMAAQAKKDREATP